MAALMQNHTTEELFHLAKTGDNAAFTALYRRTWQPLYELAYHKTKDEDEAKDIVQDIYIVLWQKIGTIELQGSVAAYLYSMAKYEIIRRMRRFLKAKQHHYDYQQLIDSMVAPSYQAIFADELKQRLKSEIEALPERQQRILRLHSEKNYTTREIADELNIAEQTVKNQLVHARRKVRSGIKAGILSSILL
ncbi:RNA polymerase sigma factor [Parapedobacter sp. GCM10030251]|uniref:RNA polymerase sigma factor n=1 Tax=Parapedobacter sp. GCM10030251 TaxID=3273419 RepID=UPI003610DBB9